MPRRAKTKIEKPYIVVFCEGESEQAYIDFLKKEFQDVAILNWPKSTGLLRGGCGHFLGQPMRLIQGYVCTP